MYFSIFNEMIKKCGQFKLIFTSHASWGGENQFRMNVASEVSFAIKFMKQKHLGQAPLQYVSFVIHNTSDDECNPIAYSTENGSMESNDFSFENNQYRLTIFPQGVWENGGPSRDFEMQMKGRSTNCLALWNTFYKGRVTKKDAARIGYVIVVWQPGNRAVIASKKSERSMLMSDVRIMERTSMIIKHTPEGFYCVDVGVLSAR